MVCDAFIGDPRPNLVLVEVSDEEGDREGSGGEREWGRTVSVI